MTISITINLDDDQFEDLQDVRDLIGASEFDDVFLRGLTLIQLCEKGTLYFKPYDSKSFSPIAITVDQCDEIERAKSGNVSVFDINKNNQD